MKPKKLGIKETNHRESLDAMIISLRYSGFWLQNKVPHSFQEKIYGIYNKIVIAIIVTFAATVFADLCSNYDDIIILTDDGCILAGISVIIFKILNFNVRSNRIKALIEAIHEPISNLSRSSDVRVKKAVENCSFYEKILLRGFWTIGAILSAALIFFVPVEEENALPIRARYPFDIERSPIFSKILLWHQIWAVIAGLVSIIGMDSIVLGLYKWINVQLFVLAKNYENCATLNHRKFKIHSRSRSNLCNFVAFNERDVINESFVDRFKICARHHQRIISHIDELNEIFGFGMFVQLFASFSMICFTGFQAVLGGKNLSSLVKFGVYLGAAFSQLLNWSWNGNSLVYQSAAIATSQWFSGWENECSNEILSLMTISLIRSKRSLSLKAGKFYTMSMETFVAILKSSYSFFALLTKMNSTE